jgi:hypothetical protein
MGGPCAHETMFLRDSFCCASFRESASPRPDLMCRSGVEAWLLCELFTHSNKVLIVENNSNLDVLVDDLAVSKLSAGNGRGILRFSHASTTGDSAIQKSTG